MISEREERCDVAVEPVVDQSQLDGLQAQVDELRLAFDSARDHIEVLTQQLSIAHRDLTNLGQPVLPPVVSSVLTRNVCVALVCPAKRRSHGTPIN